MRLLVTADWQTRVSNLASCRRAADSLLALVRDSGIECVAVAGDLKDRYNPIDIRVLTFWREFVRDMREAGATPFLVLGNHDRTSLTADSATWFPSLADAGAVAFDAPGTWTAADGSRLFALPYSRNGARFAEQAAALTAMRPDPERDVLIFHETFPTGDWLKGRDGIRLKDAGTYRFAFGGDIHAPQRFGENRWYAGSPFPHSWSEANQRKSFLLFVDGGVRTVPTGLPAWHDPSLPGYIVPEDWNGERVRLHVLGAGPEVLAAARRRAAKTHPGAVVEFVPAAPVGHVPPADAAESEVPVLKRHLASRLPKADRAAGLAWVRHHLDRLGDAPSAVSGVRFLRTAAENFLSFPELELDLAAPGITAIVGTNEDRSGRSNGSGKTSLLSSLPAALYGRTFKGQRHDGWAMRDAGRCSVAAEFELRDGAVMRVERCRRPSSVRLWCDGVEISAGGHQIDVSREVERLCGWTWDVFGAAVFLSQETVGGFLWGTDSQRHELITRLCGLDRYEVARISARLEIRETAREKDRHAATEHALRSRVETLRETGDAKREAEAAKERMANYCLQLEQAEQDIPPMPDKGPHEAAKKKVDRAVRRAAEVLERWKGLKTELERLANSPEVCAVCGSDLSGRAEEMRERAKRMQPDIDAAAEQSRLAEKELGVARKECRVESRRLRRRLVRRKAYVQTAEAFRIGMELETANWHRLRKLADERDRDLVKSMREAEIAADAVRAVAARNDFLVAAAAVLDREAAPADLCVALMPVLNRASDRYSELFARRGLRVQFAVEDGKCLVSVDNPDGGATLGDLSAGERRMAALIASFAIREVAGGSGLLILDEPCAGLDAAGVRDFARGLRRIAHDEAVLLVTHDPLLAGEVAPDRTLRVVKTGGRSRIAS